MVNLEAYGFTIWGLENIWRRTFVQKMNANLEKHNKYGVNN